MTSYRAMSQVQARSYLEAVRRGEEPDPSKFTVLRGRGPIFADQRASALLDDLNDLRLNGTFTPTKKKNAEPRRFLEVIQNKNDEDGPEFERLASPVVHLRMRSESVDLRADLDFWRWLACVHMRPIIEWRFGFGDRLANVENYGIGTPIENLIYRLWIRGDIGYDPAASGDELDRYRLALVDDHELWRSHLHRQSYATDRHLAHALLRLQNGELEADETTLLPLSTQRIRQLAKRMKRIRANIVFAVLDQAQTERILVEQHRKLVAPETG